MTEWSCSGPASDVPSLRGEAHSLCKTSALMFLQTNFVFTWLNEYEGTETTYNRQVQVLKLDLGCWDYSLVP